MTSLKPTCGIDLFDGCLAVEGCTRCLLVRHQAMHGAPAKRVLEHTIDKAAQFAIGEIGAPILRRCIAVHAEILGKHDDREQRFVHTVERNLARAGKIFARQIRECIGGGLYEFLRRGDEPELGNGRPE
jgi:hypothetical protein